MLDLEQELFSSAPVVSRRCRFGLPNPFATGVLEFHQFRGCESGHNVQEELCGLRTCNGSRTERLGLREFHTSCKARKLLLDSPICTGVSGKGTKPETLNTLARASHFQPE